MQYEKLAKEKWGETQAYKEYERRDIVMKEDLELMELFKDADSSDFPKKLQEHITKNYYTCTDEILKSYAEMYLSPDFKSNIDAYAGEGSAEKASKSILEYCSD